MSDKPTPPPPPEHIPAAPRAEDPTLESGVPPVPLPSLGGTAAAPSPYGPDTTAPPIPVPVPAPTAAAPVPAPAKSPAPPTAPIPIPEPYVTTAPPPASNAGRWIIAVIATIAIGAIVGVGALVISLVRPEPAPITIGESGNPTSAPQASGAPNTSTGDIPGSIVYTGSGDSTFAITLPDGPGVLAVADMTHTGAGGFWVTAYNDDDVTIGGLVSARGPYDGTVMLNSLFDEDTASLEVLADGAWTVTVRSIDTVETLAGPYAGDHDTVFKYEGPGGTASSTHGGESNFIIWSFGEPRKQLVENEIGVFSGTAEFQAGPTYVAVVADGPWTLEIK